jgi:hypothetical protein
MKKKFPFNGYEIFEKHFEGKTRRDRIKNEVFKVDLKYVNTIRRETITMVLHCENG